MSIAKSERIHDTAERDDATQAITRITPADGMLLGDLIAVWQARELLYFLCWRDIKVRYKQTVLGAAWAIVQPLMLTLTFTVIFGRLAKVPSNGIPYPLFSYSGLLPWTYFANALALSSLSLVSNMHIITKMYFPRLIIPLTSMVTGLIDLCVALLIVFGLMVWYHTWPGFALLALPLFVVLALISALGAALWLSALNVRYRDVRFLVPFLIQVWFFATPVIYPGSLVHGKAHVLYNLNPMNGVVEGFRWSLLHGYPLDIGTLLMSSAISLAILVSGLFYFRKTEGIFTDIL